MKTPTLRALLPVPPRRSLLALAAAFLTAALGAQGGWKTEEDPLDGLSPSVGQFHALRIGNLFNEGTRDAALATEDGLVLAYGVGRYRHHAAVTTSGALTGARIAFSGAGLADTVVTSESTAVRRWIGDGEGLTELLEFATGEFTDGRAIEHWQGSGGADLVTILDRDFTGDFRALHFLAQQPFVNRFGSMSPLEITLGQVQPRQTLMHDFFATDEPVLIGVWPTNLVAYPVFGPMTGGIPVFGGPQDGLVCICPAGTGGHPIFWVGRNGGSWVGAEVNGTTVGNMEPLSSYFANMDPLRSVEFADLEADGTAELVLAFDDRILITRPADPTYTDQWLPAGPLDVPTGYSGSSPAAIDDVDGDGDLDILVAYAAIPGDARTQTPGEPARLVLHENLAGDVLGQRVSLGAAMGYAPPGAIGPDPELQFLVHPGSWDEVEAVVYDVLLDPGAQTPFDELTVLPEFTAGAAASGVADATTIPNPWQVALILPTGVGITSGGTSRVLLIELRGRESTSGVSPEQPVMGPSTFYIASLDSSVTMPPDGGGMVDGTPGIDDPLPIRPQVVIPRIRILDHRPPRRGTRPNPGGDV